ncbi:hypothetical protein B7O87_05170 [Cylindrospermopsis raciborskii CENA303]|uniref:Uncharacterized protein n=1 Tax=Cylindrospermopsis raciborskii CENA303 TaxID=1170769 RepID=A0A1X4G9U0_9CYAN|nr:hypothetical protein [Cylindrospermopsis raciborskii]OSO93893.1 hypothetical protein B7O87_05170 [Cylindrospermopsis raciborskii CENA303]
MQYLILKILLILYFTGLFKYGTAILEVIPFGWLRKAIARFQFNIISYKSIHESFTVWSLMELIGHYVNYRKQTSKSLSNLLPEEDYKLYGLTTHEPTQLMRKLKWKGVSHSISHCRSYPKE